MGEVKVQLKALDPKKGCCFVVFHTFSDMKKAMAYVDTFKDSCNNCPEVKVTAKIFRKA